MIELNDEEVIEVFEILCGLPFKPTCMTDAEPSTERQQGIEQILEQLANKIYQEGEFDTMQI